MSLPLALWYEFRLLLRNLRKRKWPTEVNPLAFWVVVLMPLDELGGGSPSSRRREGRGIQDQPLETPASNAEAWSSAFVGDKFGQSTTHWRKLEDRVRRGVGNPCPLLLIGLPASLVTFGEPVAVVETLIEEGEDSVE